MLLGLSIFSVFFSHVIGFAGAGGLCTLVLAFLAALGWKKDKVTHIRITSMVSHNISSLLTDDITGSVQTRVFEVVCIFTSRLRWQPWWASHGMSSSHSSLV